MVTTLSETDVISRMSIHEEIVQPEVSMMSCIYSIILIIRKLKLFSVIFNHCWSHFQVKSLTFWNSCFHLFNWIFLKYLYNFMLVTAKSIWTKVSRSNAWILFPILSIERMCHPLREKHWFFCLLRVCALSSFRLPYQRRAYIWLWFFFRSISLSDL